MTRVDPTLWALDRERIRSKEVVGVSTVVHHNSAEVLRYEAAAREITLAELLRRLLEVIAKDDLFKALLDDDEI